MEPWQVNADKVPLYEGDHLEVLLVDRPTSRLIQGHDQGGQENEAVNLCPGAEHYVWTPADWLSGEIERVLRG